MKGLLNRVVASLLLLSFMGCSLVNPAVYRDISSISDEELSEAVEKVIEKNWDTLKSAHEAGSRSIEEELTPKQVVEELRKEENGREQMEFCYAVSSGADVEVVLDHAQKLLTEEQYQDLEDRIEENRRSIYTAARKGIFEIDDENREDFYNDLEKLVVTTTVLLTAAIVYTAMPHVFYWGKITALAAISVSAGAVAATIMSIYSWYQTDQDEFEAFKEWLSMVTEEPYAAYLMVCSVISLGHSMKFSPICTSAILGVFAIYNVLSIVRDMLTDYGPEEE